MGADHPVQLSYGARPQIVGPSRKVGGEVTKFKEGDIAGIVLCRLVS